MKKKTSTLILGIETSCDETSAAIVRVRNSGYQAPVFDILSNIIWSQIAIHKKYGGIVPEVAARNHVKNIIPVIEVALQKAHCASDDIDRIAVTRGPGLITSLLVGVQVARTLAYVWKKPIVPVDHIKGHVFAALLRKKSKIKNQKSKFPILALVVSGGHTELLLLKDWYHFKKIGQTLDDAAGEAFDKVAKMLGLGFPGGPEIAKHAEKGKPDAFDFPRPMIDSKDYNFSFSGLKTAVLYKVRGQSNNKEFQVPSSKFQDVCASFQQAVVDVLVAKTLRAAKQYRAKTLVLGGGVAANRILRQTMKQEAEKSRVTFIVPEIRLCTDNAAPIAVAGYFGKPIPWQKLEADPNLDR